MLTARALDNPLASGTASEIRCWALCVPAARRDRAATSNLTLAESCPVHYDDSVLIAGWSSPAARQAHNLKVLGSNPSPATISKTKKPRFSQGKAGFSFLQHHQQPHKTMQHHHSHRPSPLDIRQLAEFDAALGEAPEAEKRRKRVVYLRDAVRQMQMSASLFKGLGCMFIPFVIIPIFWPMLFVMRFVRRKAYGLMHTQLNSALEYWRIQESELVDPAPGRDGDP